MTVDELAEKLKQLIDAGEGNLPVVVYDLNASFEMEIKNVSIDEQIVLISVE